MTRSRAVSVAVFVLASCTSAAPPKASEELTQLVRFIEDVHPRPYTYVTRSDLQALVSEETARLDRQAQPNDLERGRSLHRVLASFGDGHMAVALPLFQEQAEASLSIIPLLPKRVGDRYYVDAANVALPRGTVLLAIDDVPIDEVFASLTPLVMADGLGDSGRQAMLERFFGRYFHLTAGMRASYRVRVRLAEGQEQELELQGVGRAALTELSQARHSASLWGTQPAEPGAKAWPVLSRLDDETVLLRLSSFGIPEQDEYRERVDAIFSELDGSDTLVLDLRGNEGGFRTLGIAVLNHLIDVPYTQWQSMRTRVRSIPPKYRDRISFPFAPEEALTQTFRHVEEKNGSFIHEGDPLASLMMPMGGAYPGRVVAFVDGLTNSAAVEMVTSLLAFREDATLIGYETGGECGRHIGEMPVLYTAESGIAVLLSLFELTHVPVKGCQPGRGYLPDVQVSYDEDAFLAGGDPFIAALKALAEPKANP